MNCHVRTSSRDVGTCFMRDGARPSGSVTLCVALWNKYTGISQIVEMLHKYSSMTVSSNSHIMEMQKYQAMVTLRKCFQKPPPTSQKKPPRTFQKRPSSIPKAPFSLPKEYFENVVF